MRVVRAVAVVLLLLLTACAGVRSASEPRGDGYVEIANPAYTMSPGASATIWVPREYLDNGAPRGSVLVKKGYESVVNEIKWSQQTAPDKTPDSYR